jgi:RsiW-degrading membrane proteinase PrsW (M82 family)
LWVAIALSVIGLLIFVGVFNVFPIIGSGLDGIPLIVLGLIMAIVPAALWLAIFYRLDRLEPEPKHMVMNVYIMGTILAAAVHEPILQGVFGVGEWLYNSWWAYLLGAILVVGFLEQFIVYVTVRYVMFDHPEFDERVDGVIYAVAAGLGVATILNFSYVLVHNGVDLAVGSIRMVVNALAHASFAGVMGYFLAQARFEKTPFWYLPMGITLAAFFNGLFFFLLDRTIGVGLTPRSGQDLVFAAIVAVITLAVVFALINRANEETLRVAHQAARASFQPQPPVSTLPQPSPAPASTTPSEPSTPAPSAPAAPPAQE